MSDENKMPNNAEGQSAKKKPIFKKWWFWVIIVVVVLAIGGGASSGQSGSSSQTGATNTSAATEKQAGNTAKEPDPHENDVAYQVSKKKFETVAEPEMTEEYGYPKVSGTVKNISGKKLSYAQIEFNFYDADGAQIGSTFTNINNLDVDGVWKYEAQGFDKGAASMKMVEITCW